MPFKGEEKCSEEGCKRPAHYEHASVDDGGACKTHAKLDEGKPVALLPNPHLEEERQQALAAFQEAIESASAENREAGKLGEVMLDTFKPRADFKAMLVHMGFENQFIAPVVPNAVCDFGQDHSELAPENIGPLVTPKSGKLVAPTFYNQHHSCYWYPKQTLEAWAMRKDYLTHPDTTPKMARAMVVSRSAPVCWVYTNPDGYSWAVSLLNGRYYQARSYCRIIRKSEAFQELKTAVQTNGFNVCLRSPLIKCAVTWNAENAAEAFKNVKVPFNHIHVMACMLTMPKAEWPWEVHGEPDLEKVGVPLKGMDKKSTAPIFGAKPKRQRAASGAAKRKRSASGPARRKRSRRILSDDEESDDLTSEEEDEESDIELDSSDEEMSEDEVSDGEEDNFSEEEDEEEAEVSEESDEESDEDEAVMSDDLGSDASMDSAADDDQEEDEDFDSAQEELELSEDEEENEEEEEEEGAPVNMSEDDEEDSESGADDEDDEEDAHDEEDEEEDEDEEEGDEKEGEEDDEECHEAKAHEEGVGLGGEEGSDSDTYDDAVEGPL